mgnify:CR=1 FL=1
MFPSEQGHLVGLRADPCAASRVDEPAVAVAEHAGLPSVLLDEQAVGLGAAGGVEIVRPVAARAAAPEAGGRAAGRAADGQDRVTVGGEIGHDRGTPSGGEPKNEKTDRGRYRRDRGGLIRPGFVSGQMQSGTQASMRAFFSASIFHAA